MNISASRKVKVNCRKEECTASTRPGGLSRTKKIIRTEKDREIQFIKLCKQIRLNEKREVIAEQQRNDRRKKRKSA